MVGNYLGIPQKFSLKTTNKPERETKVKAPPVQTRPSVFLFYCRGVSCRDGGGGAVS